MKLNNFPILGRLIREDKGQALVFTAVVLTSFLGLTGIAVDAGKGYYAYELLKASTNAAALAGAAGMPSQTTATTWADNYGSQTAAWNANGIMNTVVTSVAFNCSTTITTDFNTPCVNSSGGGTGSTANEIQVTQTAKVPTWIGPLFGMPTFNIRDVATASMKGGPWIPYNIAVVMDTTASMNDSDSGTTGNTSCSTQIACAILGFQNFLEDLYPCQSAGNCTSTSTPNDLVALYVFPGVTTGTAKNDFTCPTSDPTIVPYEWTSGATSPGVDFPSGNTYQIVGFESNYKLGQKNTGATLYTSDDLVITSGGKSGCSGLKSPGGEGTYYAQVIYQAAADLINESSGTNGNGYKNAMIILSDGDATACNTQNSLGNNCSNGGSSQIYAANCPSITTANGTITSAAPCTGSYTGQPINGTEYSYTTGTGSSKKTVTIQPAGYLSPTYPSALGECGQAVQAAQYASTQSITVFTVGYGSETQNSCLTDSTYTTASSSSTYGAASWAAGDSACTALAAMSSATNGANFYSDDANGCAPTDSAISGITSLTGIFHHIAYGFSTSRLVPNGT
jgi:Flp pilus assembly protein TadG